MFGTLKYHRIIIFMNLFEIAESLRNVPKFAQILNWWRHSALGIHFRQWHPFFWTQLSFFLKNASIDLLDIKSHKNGLALPRWCFKENYHWFWPSVFQWRRTPRENFNSFLRGPKNGEFWQTITSSKLNIFWCVFLFFQILEGDSVSLIEKEGKFWWLSSFKKYPCLDYRITCHYKNTTVGVFLTIIFRDYDVTIRW